ncbi:MAG: response regulator [Thermodesulfobacteriota bacterium]
MRILCIDDEPDILELMAEFLELLGHETVTTNDAGQGLEMLLGKDAVLFDAVITDLKMPHMSGLEMVKALRDNHVMVPVIVASGQFEEDLEQLAREYNIAAVLAKPCTLMKFTEVLAKVSEEADRQ